MLKFCAMSVLVLLALSNLALGQIPTNGLVAYYPLNGNAVDATGNQNDGHIYGGVSVRSDRFGNPNAALQFDGTGYITVNNSASLQIGQTFTIAFWFKISGENASDWMGMVTKSMASKYYDAGPRAMVAQPYRVGPYVFASMASPPYDAAPYDTLEMNRWYHYTLTGDGDSVRQYLNDRLEFGFPQDYSWTFTNYNPLTLGSQIGIFEGRNLNGALDEVRIYDHPLAKSEVEALYQDGSGLTVSLPDTTSLPGRTIELPILVDDITGKDALSYQFSVKFNTPDSIFGPGVSIITAGTLSGTNGWSVVPNTTKPNQITVGAYGANPLSGSGVLLKLVFQVDSIGSLGKSSTLQFSDFVFNSGTPFASVHNGKVTVGTIICGDADLDGMVLAYDAALTLREAIGPLPAPPDPLTPQGKLNADVDQNGKIQAYDAALILRYDLQLPMPQGVTTCFNGLGKASVFEPQIGHFGVAFEREGQNTRSSSPTLVCTGLSPDDGVIALSFDVALSSSEQNGRVTLGFMPDGYIATINRMADGNFRVGIVNPRGINSDDLRLIVDNQDLQEISITHILLNSTSSPDIILTRGTEVGAPLKYDLIGAFPNPFNPSTRIVYEVPEAAPVTLEIYAENGVKVRTLLNEEVSKGRHEIVWDGTNNYGTTISSGQYFCRMRAGNMQKVIKLMTLK